MSDKRHSRQRGESGNGSSGNGSSSGRGNGSSSGNDSSGGNGSSSARGGGNGQPTEERRERSFNNLVERWSIDVARERLNEELGSTGAMLRGTLAAHEVLVGAVRHTQQAHDNAQQQLQAARSLAELGSVWLVLAQANAEGALSYVNQIAGIAGRTGVDTWNEAFGAMSRVQGIAQSAVQQWLAAVSATGPETLEAQLEHATTPLTSSPLVWPAQEAVREAMTVGARSWNEWFGSVMQQTQGGAQPPAQH